MLHTRNIHIYVCIQSPTHVYDMYIRVPCVCGVFHYLAVVAACRICDLPIHNNLHVSKPCTCW